MLKRLSFLRRRGGCRGEGLRSDSYDLVRVVLYVKGCLGLVLEATVLFGGSELRLGV